MNAAPVDIGTLIRAKDGLRGGRPCIAGTGLTIESVAEAYRRGQTPEQLHAETPYVPLASLYAAVAYYLANRPMIDASSQARQLEEAELESRPRPAAGLPESYGLARVSA